METIFSHIVQKRFSRVNEDVATDGLSFILESSERARSGFMKLLRGIEPELPNLRFRTQQSEGNIRPDMWGFDSADPRVFVENKFWAGLTENQPVSYLQQLAEFTQPTVLLVVVPAAREQTIWRELMTRLHEAGMTKIDQETSAGIVHCATLQLGPVLALTSWPRLLSALELESAEDPRTMGDLVQLRALCDAADNQAFVPMSREEITDQRIPAFLLQLNTIVQDAAELAESKGFLDLSGLSHGATGQRIGRYIRFGEKGGTGSWFGVHHVLWKRYGSTPLWLVFDATEFGRAEQVRRVLEPWAMKEGISCDSENDNFVLGIDLVASQEKDIVVNSVAASLGKIAVELKTLPPAASSAEPNDE